MKTCSRDSVMNPGDKPEHDQADTLDMPVHVCVGMYDRFKNIHGNIRRQFFQS